MMNADIVLEMARAMLITAIETHHYRLVQEWDEDGAWYRLQRTRGEEAPDEARYRLDEALLLLLDAEADAFMAEVSRPDDPQMRVALYGH